MPWIEKKMKSNSIEETGDGIVRREHLKCPWRAISTDRIGAWGSIVMPPKDAHALSPETWDCVALQGERDFADMIKLRILRYEIILWANSMQSIRGRQKSQSQRKRHDDRNRSYRAVTWERLDGPLRLWRWRKGPSAKECRSLVNLEKAKDRVSPRVSKRSTA